VLNKVVYPIVRPCLVLWNLLSFCALLLSIIYYLVRLKLWFRKNQSH